jgi:hypothetical protein
MKERMVLFKGKRQSDLPKVRQFGKLLELLSLLPKVNSPPLTAQFNEGHEVVRVESDLCDKFLEWELSKAGFDVVVGFGEKRNGGDNDCPNHCPVSAI